MMSSMSSSIGGMPIWLRKSDLARQTAELGLDLDPDLFRKGLILANPNILTDVDFVNVMICMDYWGVDEWPDEVYEYIIGHVAAAKTWRDEFGCGIAQHV